MTPSTIQGTLHSIKLPGPDDYQAVKIVVKTIVTKNDGETFENFIEFEFKKGEPCDAKVGDEVEVSYWLQGNLSRKEGRAWNTLRVAGVKVMADTAPGEMPF